MPNQDKKDDDHEQKPVSPDKHAVGSSKSSNGVTMETQQAQDRIGLGLKHMYQNVLEEPLPDDMMALLDQLGGFDDNSGTDSDSDE
ncbi:NepR family anti-sigma factor [Parasphingorhabdus sp.]|uniref:NepR family anti-sigma factor n=1 Tax=Parasphingorhabdus sp. TaxID=2709688 RepID=UPI003C72FF89